MNNSLTGNEQATFSPKIRWFILFLMSTVIFGSYYAFDAMSTLREVMEINLGFSAADYGLIIGMYSFPNTFLMMAVIGGIIIDRYGIKKTGFVFALLCALGVFLTAYGASNFFLDHGPGFDLLQSLLPAPSMESTYKWTPQLVMMISGRLLFGLGSETLIIVQNKVIAKWFKGKELAFAFGLNLAVCRLGTAAALMFSPIIVENSSFWSLAIWAAAIVMGISFLLFILYVLVDKKEEVILNSEDEQFKISDIVKLLKNKSFVFICLLCVTFYAAVFPFQAFCADMLHNKFGISIKWSGILTSTVIWGTIFFTPVFGWFVDRKGKRASLMIYGSIMLVIVHLTLGLTNITPFIAMFLLGISFSLVPAAMWPSVAIIVEEKRLGTAYGLMTSIQNLGLFAVPILAGAITQFTNRNITTEMLKNGTGTLDYTITMIMFSLLGILGLIFAILLKKTELSSAGHGLENPSQ